MVHARAIAGALVVAAVAAGCSRGPAEVAPAAAPTPSPSAPVVPAEGSPAGEPATPEPDALVPTTAPASPTCVNGWITPARDDPLVREALRVIRRTMGVRGGFSLQDLRYFEGPESPPSEKGYLEVVERWYVKGHLRSDPSFRGRWLVERRAFGSGVAAVAPYDTGGFSSPDWIGFQYQFGSEPRAYEGLPGEWVGTPYDFVEGGEGLDFPGLPDEVRGCLDGT